MKKILEKTKTELLEKNNEVTLLKAQLEAKEAEVNKLREDNRTATDYIDKLRDRIHVTEETQRRILEPFEAYNC